MKLFKKILVPYDFSDCAKNALREALKICDKHNGEITIMHVLNLVTTPGDLEEARQQMERELNELSLIENIDGGVIVKKGIPAEEIVNTIDEEGYSLCIMGTNQRHNIFSELVGTHALKIIQNVKKPIIVIPGDQHLNGINKIAFATDFKKLKSTDLLEHIRDIAQGFGSELHLLNVSEHPENYSEKEAEEALGLHNFFEDVNHGFFFSKEKDPVDGIMQYVKEKNIDLLAMAPRKHTFFNSIFNDSVSERIALKLSIPLFTLHE